MSLKTSLFALFTLSLLFFTTTTYAQINDGTTPPSFKFGQGLRIPVEVMPPIPLQTLQEQDSINDLQKGPYRFGYNHIVNFTTANSGVWKTLPNGDRIWLLRIQSPGAQTINLAFGNFILPHGAKLYVYAPDHSMVLGGFTDRDNHADQLFGTELIDGDDVIVEYYEPQAVANQGSFTLFRVTHGYRTVSDYAKSFGDAGNCENNINCPVGAAWQTQKRAVVCLVSGGSEFCSGALVNNTSNDGTPYVLTANHCGTADGTWVYRFNWEAAGCTNPGSNPSSQSISGGQTVAHNAGSDFDLTLMNSTPPANYNVFYAGWSNLNVVADSAVGIHHPEGDIKKISFASNQTQSGTYSGATCWRVGQWTNGVTEPGSSGSPLFDQNHRIIGQLYGGPSSCTASASNKYDYYGKFATSWNTGTTAATRLKDWLDPGNTGATTNDGYDPNVATVALDAALSGVVSPSGTACLGSVTPVVTLRNSGSTTLTAVTITYNVDGGTNQTYNWTGSLASLQSTSVTLAAISPAAGTHTLNATCSAPNGGTDANSSNNTASGSFTLVSPTAVALPFTEGFQGGTFPPTGWTIVNTDNDNTWVRTTTAGGFGASSASAQIDQYSPANSTAGELDHLMTPYISFANASTPAYMTFNVAYARYNSSTNDSLAILASTDCGATWTRVYIKGGSSLATAGSTTNLFTPTTAQWRKDSVPLNAYIGQSSVMFDFEFISDWGNAAYVDDININALIASNDAAVQSITAPTGSSCSTAFTPSFVLKNAGTTTLTSTTVTYRTDNGSNQTYNWTGSLTANQTATVTLPAQTAAVGNHTFTVIVSSPNGGTDANHSNDSLSSSFTINATPTVNLGNNVTQCGGTVTLNAGNTGATFHWSTNASTQSITAASSGTYAVTVTNASGCSASASVQVTINSKPTQALGPDISLCGGSVTLDAGNAGSTYAWSTSATTQTINVSVAGTYTVTVTNASGCTQADTINVTSAPVPVQALGPDITQCGGTVALDAGPGASSYAWSNGQSTRVTQITATGHYSVTVTNQGGCTNVDTINVTINSLPTQALGADVTQCSGSITLDAGNPGSTYEWSDASTTQTLTALSTGTYSVTVTNAAGCVEADTINVTLNTPPVQALGADVATCDNSVTLDAGNAGSTYVWSTGSTAQTIIATASGSYSVSVTNAAGCVTSDTILVTLNSPPTINLGSDTSVCGNFTLDAGSFSGYQWSTGSTAQTVTLASVGTNVVAVTVTDANGCTGTDAITVNLHGVPNNVGLTATSDTVCQNAAPVDLTGTPSSGVYGGPGVSGSQFTPSQQLLGFDTLSYTYTDNDGCSATATTVLLVDGCTGIDPVDGINQISLYPNPASNQAVVLVQGHTLGTIGLQLVALDGRVLYHTEQTVATGTVAMPIDLSHLAAAVYFVRVSTANSTATLKLVKE